MRQVHHDALHLADIRPYVRKHIRGRGRRHVDEARRGGQDRGHRPGRARSDLRDDGHGHGGPRQVSLRGQALVGVPGRRAHHPRGPQDLRSGRHTRPPAVAMLLRGEATRADRQGLRAGAEADARGRADGPSRHEVQAPGHGVPEVHVPVGHDCPGGRARHIPYG